MRFAIGDIRNRPTYLTYLKKQTSLSAMMCARIHAPRLRPRSCRRICGQRGARQAISRRRVATAARVRPPTVEANESATTKQETAAPSSSLHRWPFKFLHQQRPYILLGKFFSKYLFVFETRGRSRGEQYQRGFGTPRADSRNCLGPH